MPRSGPHSGLNVHVVKVSSIITFDRRIYGARVFRYLWHRAGCEIRGHIYEPMCNWCAVCHLPHEEGLARGARWRSPFEEGLTRRIMHGISREVAEKHERAVLFGPDS